MTFSRSPAPDSAMRVVLPVRAVGALVVSAVVVLGSALGPSTRRNIPLILADDLGPQLGCWGDPIVWTPHLCA